MIRLSGSGGSAAPAFTTTLENYDPPGFAAGISTLIINHNLNQEIRNVVVTFDNGTTRGIVYDRFVYYRSATNQNLSGGMQWYTDSGDNNTLKIGMGWSLGGIGDFKIDIYV